MILQALYDYYQRADLSPQGWERKEIPFLIVLDHTGRFVMIEDKTDDKNKRGLPLLVPMSEIRSGKNAWMQPNLLWDHYGFVFGVQKHKPNGEPDPSDSPEKAERQRQAFADRIASLYQAYPASAGLRAIDAFYETEEYKKAIETPSFKAVLKIPGANLTFRLVDSVELIAHEPWINSYLSQPSGSEAEPEASTPSVRQTCLVTGDLAPIARLHPKTKGVCDKPAPLAAANTTEFPAYSSFCKSQGFIFPVGQEAAFAYTTALNHLLAKGSRNRFQVGDASTVCWAERDTEFDPVLAEIFGTHDNPDDGVQAVVTLFEAVKSGRFEGTEGETLYFVLGLAPNAARISVRFFHRLKLRELAPRILRHFEDLRLAHGPREPDYPSLFRLLTACAVQGKADNVPPNLGGAILDAILAGPDAPYPAPWINAAVTRCRAEQEVNYHRAAGIKAYLNRTIRRTRNEKEFQPMLDPDNPNAAYRLGRLFAVLEKIQEEASPGLNATIRDRYYGAASSTPVAVFTTLLRLKNAHLKKLATGRVVYFEKLLGEILGEVADFPAHLALPDQGRFALGYYHQRQAFFTKSEKPESTEENT